MRNLINSTAVRFLHIALELILCLDWKTAKISYMYTRKLKLSRNNSFYHSVRRSMPHSWLPGQSEFAHMCKNRTEINKWVGEQKGVGVNRSKTSSLQKNLLVRCCLRCHLPETLSPDILARRRVLHDHNLLDQNCGNLRPGFYHFGHSLHQSNHHTAQQPAKCPQEDSDSGLHSSVVVLGGVECAVSHLRDRAEVGQVNAWKQWRWPGTQRLPKHFCFATFFAKNKRKSLVM